MNGLKRITEDLFERGCISAEDAATAGKFFFREGEMRKRAQEFIGTKKLTCPDLGERLAITLCAADIAHVRYAEKGISDSIFYDTMSDIGVWTADCRRTGSLVNGLDNTAWLAHHVRLELFKLGRLQFQPIKRPMILNMGLRCALRVQKLPQMCLNVHIPRGGRLDENACKASFYAAPIFFKKYFDKEYSVCTCLSWLLYPGNERFMKKGSNILKFADMFDVIGERKFDGDALKYIFGSPKPDLGKIVPTTSLQKSALEYYKAGGRFGLGFGVKTLKG